MQTTISSCFGVTLTRYADAAGDFYEVTINEVVANRIVTHRFINREIAVAVFGAAVAARMLGTVEPVKLPPVG